MKVLLIGILLFSRLIWAADPFASSYYERLGLDPTVPLTAAAVDLALEAAIAQAKADLPSPISYREAVRHLMEAQETLRDSERKSQYDETLRNAPEAIPPDLERVLEVVKSNRALRSDRIRELAEVGGRNNLPYLKKLVSLLSAKSNVSNAALDLLKILHPDSEEFVLFLLDRTVSRRSLIVKASYFEIMEDLPLSGKALERLVDYAFFSHDQPELGDAFLKLLEERLPQMRSGSPENRKALASIAEHFAREPLVVAELLSFVDQREMESPQALFDHAIRSIPFEVLHEMEAGHREALMASTLLLLRMNPAAAGAFFSFPDSPNKEKFLDELEVWLSGRFLGVGTAPNLPALRILRKARNRYDDVVPYLRRCVQGK